MLTYSSWSVLWCDGILDCRHQNVMYSSEGMDVSMKTCANVLELLTVLCTDTAISTGRDPRVSGRLESISGKHVQLVSANFKGASKLVSYLKYWNCCLYHVHDTQRRNLVIPWGLALNVTVMNQCSRCANDDLTGGRCGWRRLFGNCTFKIDIESIPIYHGGAPIIVTKVALDHIEVAQAVHQDDGSGMPKTKHQGSLWHPASAATF